MYRIGCIILGYLIGCIQTAYFVGKCTNNIDIREHGSGNSGATNALRVLGLKAGIITFIGDFLKACIAIYVCKYIFNWDELTAVYAGIGVITGHNWPFYLKFKGGKGIAATLGTLISINYMIGLIAILVLFIVVVTTKYVSLGSLIFTSLIPVLMYVFYKGNDHVTELILVSLLYTIFAFIRHKENIVRLRNGKESKIGSKSKI